MSELVLLFKEQGVTAKVLNGFSKGFAAQSFKASVLFSRTFISLCNPLISHSLACHVDIWCAIFLLFFFFFFPLSFDTIVGSRILHNISGIRLWEVTPEHAEGHDSICACQAVMSCWAHSASSVWERRGHSSCLSPRRGSSRPSTAVFSLPWKEDALGCCTTRCLSRPVVFLSKRLLPLSFAVYISLFLSATVWISDWTCSKVLSKSIKNTFVT